MLTLGSYYKKGPGRLANHRCISLLGAAGFLRREALVAQVKGHLFPYSRYFTLSTESISDEQSRGWQSHIFFNRKQQSAQIYRRTLQLY